MLLVCNDHTSHENKFILPVIENYNLIVVRDIENQHLIEETIEYRLKHLMELYQFAVTDDGRLESGDAIYKTFNEFIACNIWNMNKEEETVNKLLWLHYSEEEIYCIYNAIAVSIPADKITSHGRWVMRGINIAEIIKWLLSYHGSHPEAFKFVLQLAEDELPEERWNNIQEALCEGEMMPC